MESKKTMQLIKGQFTPDEANDVLLNLVNHKINFHELKNFGSKERFAHPDMASLERIQALRVSKMQLENLIRLARENNKMLEVNAEIQVEVVASEEIQQ